MEKLYWAHTHFVNFGVYFLKRFLSINRNEWYIFGIILVFFACARISFILLLFHKRSAINVIMGWNTNKCTFLCCPRQHSFSSMTLIFDGVVNFGVFQIEVLLSYLVYRAQIFERWLKFYVLSIFSNSILLALSDNVKPILIRQKIKRKICLYYRSVHTELTNRVEFNFWPWFCHLPMRRVLIQEKRISLS